MVSGEDQMLHINLVSSHEVEELLCLTRFWKPPLPGHDL
jgi:hypothetical protein